MSKFEDHLWREFVREHGNDLRRWRDHRSSRAGGPGPGWSLAPALAWWRREPPWRSCSAPRAPPQRSP